MKIRQRFVKMSKVCNKNISIQETEDKLRVDLSKTIGVLDFLTRDLESKGKSLEVW